MLQLLFLYQMLFVHFSVAQVVNDPCTPNPCENGVCRRNGSSSGFICDCFNGYGKNTCNYKCPPYLPQVDPCVWCWDPCTRTQQGTYKSPETQADQKDICALFYSKLNLAAGYECPSANVTQPQCIGPGIEQLGSYASMNPIMPGERAVVIWAMTYEKCRAFCIGEGNYSIMAVSRDNCVCANKLYTPMQAPTTKELPCLGNSNQKCGNFYNPAPVTEWRFMCVGTGIATKAVSTPAEAYTGLCMGYCDAPCKCSGSGLMFQCKNSSICIDLYKQRDAVCDCPDCSDEDCCDIHYQCDQTRYGNNQAWKCIAKQLVNNGKAECNDNSDEAKLVADECAAIAKAGQGSYSCRTQKTGPTVGKCIPYSKFGDKNPDCPLGDDEGGCYPVPLAGAFYVPTYSSELVKGIYVKDTKVTFVCMRSRMSASPSGPWSCKNGSWGVLPQCLPLLADGSRCDNASLCNSQYCFKEPYEAYAVCCSAKKNEGCINDKSCCSGFKCVNKICQKRPNGESCDNPSIVGPVAPLSRWTRRANCAGDFCSFKNGSNRCCSSDDGTTCATESDCCNSVPCYGTCNGRKPTCKQYSSFWVGTAPFCDNTQCCPIDHTAQWTDQRGDGKACSFGHKVLCVCDNNWKPTKECRTFGRPWG